jgi:hypothetical protein
LAVFSSARNHSTLAANSFGALSFLPSALSFLPSALSFLPSALSFLPSALSFLPGAFEFLVSAFEFLAGAFRAFSFPVDPFCAGQHRLAGLYIDQAQILALWHQPQPQLLAHQAAVRRRFHCDRLALDELEPLEHRIEITALRIENKVLLDSDAGVQVAFVIEVHAPGLFRGNLEQRAGQRLLFPNTERAPPVFADSLGDQPVGVAPAFWVPFLVVQDQVCSGIDGLVGEMVLQSVLEQGHGHVMKIGIAHEAAIGIGIAGINLRAGQGHGNYIVHRDPPLRIQPAWVQEDSSPNRRTRKGQAQNRGPAETYRYSCPRSALGCV